ncbi:Meiotic Sister-Chromatid recombination aldehyde dehydrogenase, partial [Quaeritorhiza haematococci]
LESRGLDNLRLPARQPAPQVDAQRGDERVGPRRAVVGLVEPGDVGELERLADLEDGHVARRIVGDDLGRDDQGPAPVRLALKADVVAVKLDRDGPLVADDVSGRQDERPPGGRGDHRPAPLRTSPADQDRRPERQVVARRDGVPATGRDERLGAARRADLDVGLVEAGPTRGLRGQASRRPDEGRGQDRRQLRPEPRTAWHAGSRSPHVEPPWLASAPTACSNPFGESRRGASARPRPPGPPPQAQREKKKIFVEAPPEVQAGWEGEFIETNSIKDPTDPRNILCYDPATGYKLGLTTALTTTTTTTKSSGPGTIRAATPDEVKGIVSRARLAQQKYSTTSFAKRRAILGTLLDWIVENQDLIVRVGCRDTGKSGLDGYFGEIIVTCEKIKWTMAHGEKYLQPEYRESGTLTFLQSARVEYHPVGVMGLIVSWNYPFHNAISPIITALMAGNACVVKCSEHVAWSCAFWERAIRECLRVNGVDENLVALYTGWPDSGEALIEVADKVTFIGSPKVGKLVMRKASETLTPVVLELGGKDAAIIFDDAPYESGCLIQTLLRGGMQNCGQNCAGLERLIIQEGIHDRVVKDLADIVSNFRIGPSLDDDVVDVGAITMPSQIAIIQDLIDDAVAKGATVVCGGKPYVHPKFPKGQYYTPTLIKDVTPTMRIAQEEVFGPVLVIYKPFTSETEALALANSTEFGLSSSVFTSDYEKAERVARKLKVGMHNVNGWGMTYLCQSLPFGGIKVSGFDRFAGVEGLRGNTHIRSATTEKFRIPYTNLAIHTPLPPLLFFPLKGK